MERYESFAVICKSSMRAVVAAGLCFLLVDQPLLAEALPNRKIHKTSAAATEIQGQQRVLHALNRLTFGPRPGEVEAVEAMGLDRWFARQLNPASIPDTALEQR